MTDIKEPINTTSDGTFLSVVCWPKVGGAVAPPAPPGITPLGHVKELLVHEFGASLGFYVPPRKNRSEVVYDTSGSASYIEAAISLLGISNEQLVQTVSSRLRDEIKQTTTVPWPPQVSELEQEEAVPPLLVKLMSSLKKPGWSMPDAKALVLASMITYYVTGRPTSTSINLSMHLHGLTRS